MDLNIKNSLKNYGLNEREISIYLASIELGPSSMSNIAEKSGIKRPTAYMIYNLLEKRGLMGSYKKTSGLYFFAKDPAVLSEKSQQVLTDINNIIPKLRDIENKRIDKPKITYYEGVENYKEIVEDILRYPNITLYAIGSLGSIFDILTKKYDKDYFIPKRIEQNIKVKAILPYSDEKNVSWMRHNKELREIRYLPKNYDLESLLIVYDDKVVRINSKEIIFITVIESSSIAQDERTKFELMWKSLK